MPPMPTADLLSVADVAERLRCSRWTVHRYISEGKLKSIKLGGRGVHVIEREDFDRFIEAEKAAAVARFDEAAS